MNDNDFWGAPDDGYLAEKSTVNSNESNDAEEWSTGRWLGAVGDAAWQGVRDGALLDTPETFYRVARTVGDMFGSEDLQEWAGQGIDDIKRAREEDPFYKVSADVMNDYTARSIYGGISSVINSTAAGAGGAAIGALTGGAGYIPMLAGYALSHGGLFGLAEYDNYIDDAYTKFKEVNPDLTWQQVQDDVNSEAVLSALAEGGLEMGGDLLMGRLLGTAGKSVAGSMGKQAWRKQAAKVLKGILVTGPLAEVPPELLTTAIQTELRNSSGITQQSVAEALKESFGATYVSSMMFGGGGAIAEHAVNAGKRGREQQQYDIDMAQIKEERATLAEKYRGNEVVKALNEGKTSDEFFDTLRDKAITALEEQGVSDEVSYRELIAKETPKVKLPVNLTPESSEYKAYAKTELTEFGLGYEVPMGRKAQKRRVLKTVGDVNRVFNEIKSGNLKKPAKGTMYWQVGKISDASAAAINSSLGLDVKGRYFTLRFDDIQHVINEHPKLTAEEFSLLPHIIENFTTSFLAKKKSGEQDYSATGGKKFVLSSKTESGRYFACEALSIGENDKRIELVSFYREDHQDRGIDNNKALPKKGDQVPDVRSTLKLTSETNLDSNINSTTDSTVVNNLLGYGDKFVKYLKGEKLELTSDEANFFSKVKRDMEKDMDTAYKLGAVDSVTQARFNDLLGIDDYAKSISPEDHKKIVQDQLDVISGKKQIAPEDYDSVNSSLLVPEMENAEFRNERIAAMGEMLTTVKDKDKHTTERLMRDGAQAVANGTANLAVFKQFHASFANSDVAIMAAGMLHNQMNSETNIALFEAEKTGRREDMAYAMLKMEAGNQMTELLSGMGTDAGRALRAIGTIKEKSGQELNDALQSVLGRKASEVNARMLTQIISNLVKHARPKNDNYTTKIAIIQEKVQKILANTNESGLSDEDMLVINDLFKNTDMLELTAQIKQRTRYQRVRDALIESTVAGMLTGPTTHIVNTISGIGTIASEIHDRLFSGMIYGKGSAINGRAEAKAMLHGLGAGLTDAIYAAKTAFWSGQSSFGDQSEKAGQERSGWSKENLYLLAHGIKEELTREQIEAMGGMGGLSKVIYDSFDLVGKTNKKLSTNIMLGSDEFLRVLGYNMQRRALAYREMEKANKLGQDGQAVYSTIMDGKFAPPEIHEELVEYTRYLTFQDPVNPDSGWKNISDLRNKHPELMFAVPFLRTPLNIAKWVGTRTPIIANLFKEYRDAMSDEGDMAKKQIAEARMLTGSLIWHSALVLAANGLLTGSGPTDDDEKELLYATGWRPNSLHINDAYYELTRLDPIATFLNTMASFVEISSDLDHAELSEVAAATMGSALKVVSDKYYLSGISDLLMVLRDSKRYGAPYFTKLAANLVPFSGARRTAARGLDPVMREARDFVEKVAKDTPIASHAAAARRTILGEAVKYPGGALGRAFSPVKTGTDKHDPVYDELYRLADNQALSIGKPQRSFRHKDKSIKLSAQQYSKYLELSGIGIKLGGLNAKERIAKLIASPQYKLLSDEQRSTILTRAIKAYRRRAKSLTIAEDRELTEFFYPDREDTRVQAFLNIH